MLQDTIQLDIKVPATTGLEGLLLQLRQAREAADAAGVSLGKMTGRPGMGLEDYKREIRKLQIGKQPPMEGVAKGLNLDLAQMRAYVQKHKELQKEFRASAAETFRSAASAARVVQGFQAQAGEVRQKQLAALQTPSVKEVHGDIPGKKVKAEVTGVVSLGIPAKQIDAKVEGVVSVTIPAGQVVATAATPAEPPHKPNPPAELKRDKRGRLHGPDGRLLSEEEAPSAKGGGRSANRKASGGAATGAPARMEGDVFDGFIVVGVAGVVV